MEQGGNETKARSALETFVGITKLIKGVIVLGYFYIGKSSSVDAVVKGKKKFLLV